MTTPHDAPRLVAAIRDWARTRGIDVSIAVVHGPRGEGHYVAWTRSWRESFGEECERDPDLGPEVARRLDRREGARHGGRP